MAGNKPFAAPRTKGLHVEDQSNTGLETGRNSASPLSPNSSRGPSAARGEVRERILVAARQQFIDRGYDATTMSAVARDAGCTPAMVTYYFESKQRLFRECMNLPRDPAEEIISVLGQGIEGAGKRVTERVLDWYEDELTADTMRALAVTLLSDPATTQRFREYVRHSILDVVSEALGMSDEFAEEIEFAVATMFGMVVMRYLVRLEPMASMSRERLVAELSPLVQNRIDRAMARYQMRMRTRGEGPRRVVPGQFSPGM